MKNDGHALTSAGEDYLEAIYRIMCDHPEESSVRSVDVSEQLGVSKASVNKALSTLKEGGFVEQTRYGRVELTRSGRTYAAEVWRLMEHALSRDTSDKLMKYLERQGIKVDSD